jgi:hypothetical protein
VLAQSGPLSRLTPRVGGRWLLFVEILATCCRRRSGVINSIVRDTCRIQAPPVLRRIFGRFVETRIGAIHRIHFLLIGALPTANTSIIDRFSTAVVPLT